MESTSPMTPGDNPNKLAAQRRRNNRPKEGSKPRESVENTGLRWAEPSEHPRQINFNLSELKSADPAIFIELKSNLPRTISESSENVLEQALMRTNLDHVAVENTVTALRSQTYFKAARQLYSTLHSEEKAKGQPLKAVYYDDAALPSTIASGLSMIGHFDSRLGPADIVHAPVLFRNWIEKGIQADPITNENENDEYYVFNDNESHSFVKSKIRAEFSRRHDEPFNLRVGERVVRVTLPLLGNGEVRDDIVEDYPDHHELLAMYDVLNCTEQQWANQDIPINRDAFTTVYRVLNLVYNIKTPQDQRIQFEDFCMRWRTRYKKHIELVFSMSPAPNTSSGYASQIVSSTELNGTTPLPLADSDAALGFVYDPCLSVTVNPKFSLYSTRKRETARADYAAQDLTKFAKD